MKSMDKEYKQSKSIFKKYTLKKIFRLIVTSHHSPHEIAFGFAIGLFLSVIPTFALGMFVALFIAWKFKLNYLATYLGTFIVNPVTATFFYAIDYSVGSFLIGQGPGISFPLTLDVIKSVALELYVGGVVFAGILSMVMYGVVYWIVKRVKESTTN